MKRDKGIYKLFSQDKIIENFIEELGLNDTSVVSVVGAGGKTTLIENIADEFIAMGCKVIITTTTHILKPDSADDNRIYVGDSFICENTGKLKSPDEDTFLEMLLDNNCPILIEADGAKGMPCKAPAEYEPVIRPETNVVIGVLSTRCIGGKIIDVCHRPEMVSRLLKKGKNDIITNKDLEEIFYNSNGLMKGVTQGMKYIPILRIG